MSMLAFGFAFLLAGCSDFELTKTEADYDPRYQGTVEGDADLTVSADPQTVNVKFKCDMPWTAQVLDEQGEACSFASVSPESGEAGESEVAVKFEANEDIKNPRSAQLQIITEKGGTTTFTIKQDYKVLWIDPATIKDYDKYTCPGEWNPHFENGPEYMLRHDSYYSWHRMKQSDHFFVFWSPEFGENPNGEDVPANMKVDIDDLLVKAEKFFDTNVNKLGMATLGQGKSMLDNYKMQIYLIYQDEWLATGSGYDNKIGALWVNPSTCQPVGSTIAHEIGHSFQYQTYADRVQTQGVPDDGTTGFRYGFVGPDGSGNGGCAYWEQCAQWQAQRDYPKEQFESYNYGVWIKHCHQHFHHEWMRYASYWLQTYWVDKHGVEAYGRIWKESVAPEDAIMAYTRLYNGGNYNTTRNELIDYAMKMATYDIKGMREYAGAQYIDNYRTTFYLNRSTNEYQVAYASCPGATGFNVIALTVPASGTVSVDFRGLEYGAPLNAKDPGQVIDGDDKVQGTTKNYNAVGEAKNMGWRYGFVALSGSKRTYSSVGSAPKGKLSFNVPAGTEHLYLVVQGSPEVYMSHGWDENGLNDAQFPYAIKLDGTDLKYYDEPLEAEYKKEGDALVGSMSLSIPESDGEWVYTHYNINEDAVQKFFGLSAEEVSAAMVTPVVGTPVEAQEGKIVVFNEESDGTLSNNPTANTGYWLNAEGNAVSWGDGHKIYYEISDTSIALGKLGNEAGKAGDVMTMRPVFVYTKNGAKKILKYRITYKFK